MLYDILEVFICLMPFNITDYETHKYICNLCISSQIYISSENTVLALGFVVVNFFFTDCLYLPKVCPPVVNFFYV